MKKEEISKFLKDLRLEKGISQERLANDLHVDRSLISKWERGICLPDITMLKELSNYYNLDISEIIKGKKSINKKYIIIPVCLVITILLIIVFKNIYLGYKIINFDYNYDYGNQKIKLGVPKMSFMMKNNDRSFTFKNLRGSNVLESEIKKYLKTLNYSTCNDTIYYFDEKSNISIINYEVKSKILFSNIDYQISIGDYCHVSKLEEYSKFIILGHEYTNNKMSLKDIDLNTIQVHLLDGGMGTSLTKTSEYDFLIRFTVMKPSKDRKVWYVIEDSEGTYEIKDNKLIYYRVNLKDCIDKSIIPKVSTFTIKDKKLILDENYLSKYEKNIVLE